MIYGNIQAAAVMFNRFQSERRKARGEPPPEDPWPLAVGKVFLTMQFVVFSRILFRATSLDNANDVVGRLVSNTWSVAQISPELWLVLIFGLAAHYTPRSWLEAARTGFLRLPAWGKGIVLALVGAVLALFVTAEAVPYIYFQF